MAAGAATRAAGHTRSRGTVADGGDDRGAAHAAVELVRGPRAGAPRARPDLPARLAVRRPPRPAHRARLLLRHAGRRASPSSSRATATTCCAPSPTSAATAARSSPRARASAARCSARTTRGPTASTAACARRRAPRTTRASTATSSASCRWRPAAGARSCSSTPTPDAPPLAEALGDLPEVVAAHGLDVDALVFHHRAEYEVRANWKVAIENYLECYHCQLNHPGLVSVIDDRKLRFESVGLRASQFNPARRRSPARRRHRRRRGRGPVPPALPRAEVQLLSRPGEPVDRAGLARGARPLPRLPRLLVRARTPTRRGSRR